jgi:RNA polymerase sigma factor (sigma-70 family)
MDGTMKYPKLTPTEQADAWRLAMAGDTAARDRLVMSIMPLVMRLAASVNRLMDRRNDMSPEDLSQEILLRVTRNLSAYDPERGAFTTWVRYFFRAARFQFLAIRSGSMELQLRTTFLSDEVGDSLCDKDDPADIVEREESAQIALAALADMDNADGDAASRHFIGGERYVDIAKSTGECRRLVANRVRRAITLIRGSFAEHGQSNYCAPCGTIC